MNNIARTLIVVTALLLPVTALAQDNDDELKMAALEALMSAPPDKA